MDYRIGELLDLVQELKVRVESLKTVGYRKEENPQLEQTVHEVFATAPTIEVE